MRKTLLIRVSMLVTLGCGAGGLASSDDAVTGDDTGAAGETTQSADGETPSDEAAPEETDEEGGAKFDVPSGETDGNECGCGNAEWSHIWIANSGESTVSKIDTSTVEELGRYVTRADAWGNPSRTSVSLSARLMAVANRRGGVAAVWTQAESCPETNGMPGIQTSSGKDDVLAWGEDECVVWYAAFDEAITQRPVAWTPGIQDPTTCAYEDERVWTATCCTYQGESGVFVHRLDGATGTVDDTVEAVGFPGGGMSPYGGAVDGEGNFWITTLGPGRLARIDAQTLEVALYDHPAGFGSYGITVDAQDRVWMSGVPYSGGQDPAKYGVARFDPETEQWKTLDGFWSNGGLAQGADGRIWIGGIPEGGGNQPGLLWVDDDAVELGDFVPVGVNSIKGVSLDADGFVWAVDYWTAHKVEPDAPYGIVAVYDELTAPYTYSDMTGSALLNASCGPEG